MLKSSRSDWCNFSHFLTKNTTFWTTFWPQKWHFLDTNLTQNWTLFWPKIDLNFDHFLDYFLTQNGPLLDRNDYKSPFMCRPVGVLSTILAQNVRIWPQFCHFLDWPTNFSIWTSILWADLRFLTKMDTFWQHLESDLLYKNGDGAIYIATKMHKCIEKW